jgi:NADH-ubiquinone oxidoreductase chain 2
MAQVVVITIFIFILAYSLPFLKNTSNSAMLRRICSICFIYAGVLAYNTFYFQEIGSGIGIYSGLFSVSILSAVLSFFILIISGIIIIIWPNLSSSHSSGSSLISSHRLLSDLPVQLRDPIAGVSQREENSLEVKYHYVNYNIKSNEYSLVILFNILGALFLMTSSDLVSMYLSIELQSFGLYILATLYKEKYSSTSAGLKYFLLGGLSSCIILLGSGLIYSYTGLTNLESIFSLITAADSPLALVSPLNVTLMTPTGVVNNVGVDGASYLSNAFSFFNNELRGISLGVLFIFSGFLFKVAASPFHNWAPDVYDESPTLVTIWLTIMPKISIFILLLQLQIGVNLNLFLFPNFFESSSTIIGTADNVGMVVSGIAAGAEGSIFLNVLTNLLLLSSLLSLIIGSIVGLSQTKIKRLLAYSTISHIGFLLLSLSVFSNSSIEAFIFYIIQYTITNLNIFLIILSLGYIYRITYTSSHLSVQLRDPSANISDDSRKGKGQASTPFQPVANRRGLGVLNLSDMEYISSFKGIFYKNPILSISLSICLFSFAGVPPLIGFFAKQQVLYSSNSAGYFFLSLIAILVSVISAFYYLKIIKIAHSLPESPKSHPSTLLTKVPLTYLKEANIVGENSTLNTNSNFNTPHGTINITTIHSFLISVLTLIILLFMFNPELLLNYIAIISSLILNL